MKKQIVVLVLLSGALLVSVHIQARESTDDLRKMMRAASVVLLDRSASSEEVRGALVQLLDVAVLVLQPSELPADVRANLQSARLELKDGTVNLHQRLDQSYRALSAGRGFKFPEVHSIEEARAHIQDLLAASIAGLNKDNGRTTSRLLLECIIMVVTPIEN